ncbi:hypothetical protein [Neobacillus sp. YIM B06451]|uniref:hypothetical protein n=1 Tax=Neobacillus sp. YIM B06451 TaxID=3070994 RepID=UPI00292F6CA2|nr:hypothetical protein [Neobacillus sp. YIM B06451]
MAKVLNFTMPAGGTITSPCNNETIVLTGNTHVLITQTVDGKGGVHFKFHVNTQNLLGTGLTTGAQYKFVSTSNAEQNTGSSGFPSEFTAIDTLRVIAQGNVPNFLTHAIGKFTFNANGELTAFKIDFDSECK